MNSIEQRLNDISERLNARTAAFEERINARLNARAAEVERRIAARFGESGDGTVPPSTPQPDGGDLLRPGETVRRGLFIGLGEYDPVKFPPSEVVRVKSCGRDAEVFAEACSSFGGWSDVRKLRDSRATVAGIRQAIRDLAAETRPGELALVFISTHGTVSDDHPSTNDFAFLAYDGPYWEKEMDSDLALFRYGVRLLVVAHSCHSGGLFEKSAQGSDFARRFTERIAAVGSSAATARKDGQILSSDIAAIAAAARNQTAIGNSSSMVCSRVPAALVEDGWLGGKADGFTESVVSVNGQYAITSADALCKVRNRARPNGRGCVSFLDMALFAVWTMKDVSSGDSGSEESRHIPQFYNPQLLERVIAGPVGSGRNASGKTRAMGDSGARYGLFVGVNHTPCGGELQGCINDANDMKAACVELGGWESGNTIVLEDATKDQFLTSLSRLATKARSGDVLLILFSGHGGTSDGQPDNDFSFALSDGSLFEKEFRRAISEFDPGVRIIVVVDACHSDAAAIAGPTGLPHLSNVGWITASTSWQSSQDSFQGSRGNGFLTGAILDGWRNGGAAGMAEHMKAPSAVSSDPGTVSFLDLAVFVAHSWRYWHPDEQQPQYHNPEVLSAVVAGRIGC